MKTFTFPHRFFFKNVLLLEKSACFLKKGSYLGKKVIIFSKKVPFFQNSSSENQLLEKQTFFCNFQKLLFLTKFVEKRSFFQKNSNFFRKMGTFFQKIGTVVQKWQLFRKKHITSSKIGNINFGFVLAIIPYKFAAVYHANFNMMQVKNVVCLLKCIHTSNKSNLDVRTAKFFFGL